MKKTAGRSASFKGLMLTAIFSVASTYTAAAWAADKPDAAVVEVALAAPSAEPAQTPQADSVKQIDAAVKDEKSAMDDADTATAAAIADGLTTGLALSAGAIEANPLIATNPIGLVAMTGLKVGLVQYADTLPTEDKRAVMKTSSAVWGGAAANNLLVLLAAPTPLSLVAGLVAGVLIWNHMDDKYQEEDRVLAEKATKQAPPVMVETAAADPAQTSGN